jgi:hypothetical protein
MQKNKKINSNKKTSKLFLQIGVAEGSDYNFVLQAMAINMP